MVSHQRPRLDPITARLHRQPPAHGPLMLMYHAVLDQAQTPDWPWAVTRSNFEQQLDFLQAEGYATPTVSALMEDPERFSGRTVVISFDDGYTDNLEAAAALHLRSMQATWYVVSGSIGQEPAWPFDGRPGGRLMNATELRSLQQAGMEVGSHAVTHRRLSTLDTPTQLQEAARSKADLEDLLGTAVHSFAYPYGAFDNASAAAVQQAGYRSACTTAPGWMLRDGDPFRLRRLTVFNHDSTASLARKLSLGSHDVGWPQMASYFWRRLRGA